MNQRVEDVDVAVVGAGGAGLSLVIAIERAAAEAGLSPPKVAVVDPVHRREADRTWCWWADPDLSSPGRLDPLLTRSWSRLQLIGADGRADRYDLGRLRYVMLRSPDFYAAADAALDRLATAGRGLRVTAAADQVVDGPVTATVTAGATTLRARWVFDSRPAAPRRPGRTALLQHFRGWTVRFDSPSLDPDLATLMDFDLPQPSAGGVAFAYCLPLDERRALVEYTEFSRCRLSSDGYDRVLTDHLRRRWGVAPGAGATVEAVETGAIPMTDAPFSRRVGRRVFRLGTAGGATRPSTGYTFVTMNRQAEVVARRLLAGRPPVPPVPYPARHRWMDAVLLRALDRGLVDGPGLFTGLFAANPPLRVVRFLDGRSGLLDELAVMSSAPIGAMTRATIGDAAARLGDLVTRAGARPAPRPVRRSRPG